MCGCGEVGKCEVSSWLYVEQLVIYPGIILENIKLAEGSNSVPSKTSVVLVILCGGVCCALTHLLCVHK